MDSPGSQHSLTSRQRTQASGGPDPSCEEDDDEVIKPDGGNITVHSQGLLALLLDDEEEQHQETASVASTSSARKSSSAPASRSNPSSRGRMSSGVGAKATRGAAAARQSSAPHTPKSSPPPSKPSRPRPQALTPVRNPKANLSYAELARQKKESASSSGISVGPNTRGVTTQNGPSSKAAEMGQKMQERAMVIERQEKTRAYKLLSTFESKPQL